MCSGAAPLAMTEGEGMGVLWARCALAMTAGEGCSLAMTSESRTNLNPYLPAPSSRTISIKIRS